MRTNAWDKNAGWRIDYQVLTPNLKGHVLATRIYRDERFSDHAPVIIDYNYS
jgi:exodeoxyribonuclease-3